MVLVCNWVLGLSLSLCEDVCDGVVPGARLLIWDLFRLT